MRILCIDYGQKRIGLAVSDPAGRMAHPLKVIENRDRFKLFDTIKGVIKEYEVEKVLVGFPCRLNGSLSPASKQVELFLRRLRKVLSLPVMTWDERLTSKAAERFLIQVDYSRKKRKKMKDKLEAALILQDYLNYKASE